LLPKIDDEFESKVDGLKTQVLGKETSTLTEGKVHKVSRTLWVLKLLPRVLSFSELLIDFDI
jgi:hypothetical protein